MITSGDKVRHSKMPDWGLGKVMEVTSDGKARIFFIHAGEKTILLSHVDFEKVEGEEAAQQQTELPIDEPGPGGIGDVGAAFSLPSIFRLRRSGTKRGVVVQKRPSVTGSLGFRQNDR